MAMVFSGQDRPNKVLESKINDGETPYKNIIFDGNNDFQSILASKRYSVVVENVRRYNLFDRPLQNSLSDIGFKMGTATSDVLSIEAPHRKELEKLAVNLVCKEFGIPKGFIDFDAKIVNVGSIDTSLFNKNKTDKLDDIAKEFDAITFNNERKKRRLINALIQGAAKKGHYMYHLVEKELEDITKTKKLFNAYNIMMSVNDTYYWQVSDSIMDDIAHNSNPAGISDVEFPEDYDNEKDANPTIVARAINFPVLLHELVKGLYELFSYHGQFENKEMVSQIIKVEDTLSKEIWDLRFGPALWDLYREQLPIEILVEEEDFELQNYLIVDVFKLESDKFISLMEDVIQNKARPQLQKMVNEIRVRIATDNYEQTMRNFGMWDEE